MEANELMIGDWVKVLPISNKIKPHYDRIESIRKEYTGQICIEGGYHNREHNGVWDWFDWSVGLWMMYHSTNKSEQDKKN